MHKCSSQYTKYTKTKNKKPTTLKYTPLQLSLTVHSSDGQFAKNENDLIRFSATNDSIQYN